MASEAIGPSSSLGGRRYEHHPGAHMPDFESVIPALYRLLSPCTLCPRACGVDRSAGATGHCRTGASFSIASCAVHHGEEPPLSGTRGSGTIFFSNCTLSCVFCQNYPISQLGNGNPVSVEDLARHMLVLQDKGVHNINFVTPTHVVPMIVDAVTRARRGGLTLPLVYNSSGYESVRTLRLLDGIIDIYLPDAKYSDPAAGLRYSAAPNYPAVNAAALEEMFRQVGVLQCDDDGIARRGLVVRHLVLPDNIAGTDAVLSFIAQRLSPHVHVSLMAQYHPAHACASYPEINRRITRAEYRAALTLLEKHGIENGWQQQWQSF